MLASGSQPVEESEAEKLLSTANWYLVAADPIAAELVIRRLVERYPETGSCVRALELIPSILPRLPEHILEKTPNYSLLRHAILGVKDEAPGDEQEDESS